MELTKKISGDLQSCSFGTAPVRPGDQVPGLDDVDGLVARRRSVSGDVQERLALRDPSHGRAPSRSVGTNGLWRADGKEIFYLSLEGALMAVPVDAGDNCFRPGTPRRLFQTRNARSFDVTADGQRFLLNLPVADSSDTPLTVLVNWTAALKR